METGRAYRGGRVSVMGRRGFSAMFGLAAVSVLVLMGVIGWRVAHLSNDVQAVAPLVIPEDAAAQVSFPNVSVGPSSYAIALAGSTSTAATSSDDLTEFGSVILGQLINAYVGLQNAGVYSTSTAQAAAQDVATLLKADVQYTAYTSADIKTDANTSYARMLQYRSDLRTSLAPLLKNSVPEYEIFARYVQTRDSTYLAQLQTVAQEYRDAATLTAQVVVPADAVPYHVAILNAMRQFAAVLDAMAKQASDPFAVAALLQNYNRAESDMLTSFNALTVYYKSKQQ